jgi:UPF0755 protein
MRRAAPWLALAVLLAVVGAAGGYYYHFLRTYVHPSDYSGAGTGTVTVVVHSGDTATVIGQRLYADGVVASVRAFTNAANANPQSRSVQPGTYKLHRHMNAALALNALLSPAARIQAVVTIPEGLRTSWAVSLLGKATDDQTGYQQALKDTSRLGLPPYAHGNPQGYLYPDTYTIQPHTPPLQVLQGMVSAFKAEAARVHLEATAKQDGLTPGQVITVASLVQAEGGRPSDFPKIAQVIYNRRRQGMRLQLDSTVFYALHTHGSRATAAQIHVKSPYNTYAHAGLPPGPIDNPGDAAIKAALHPAPGRWLYFVTVDPKHRITRFTSSYSQFQQFVAELNRNLKNGT